MKQLGSFFNKNIVTLLIVGGVAFLVWKFRGIFSSDSSSWWNGNTEEIKSGSSNFFESQSMKNDDLKQIAEMQFAAMDQYGTDEDLLFKSLEKCNGKDLQKVFNFFGKRDYESIQGNSQPIFGIKKNLFIWYASELSGKDLDRMRSIWEKAKMNLSF